jgi:hypothetical protein
MSSAEISQAAIMLLKAKALESYGIIKDLLKQPPKKDISDEIAAEALRLVQFEGAALTLTQYFGNGLPPGQETPPPKAEEVVSEQEEPEPIKVTEDMSPTYKRAMQKEKIKASARKRKAKKDEK